jgi:hypothetical protein
MFGGPLNIKDFRYSFFIINKEYRYFFPPMISIIGIIEEDSRDIMGKSRIIKHNQLIIKRKNPLPKQTGNLSSLINKM